MIEKLSNSEQYSYGRIVGRGFTEKLIKLGEEDLAPTDEGAEVSTTKKKCPNSNCSQWNNVIETSENECTKCGTKLVSE